MLPRPMTANPVFLLCDVVFFVIDLDAGIDGVIASRRDVI